MELFNKVHLKSTAYAAVLQGHQTVVIHAYHASLLDKVGIDIYLAYIVYYNCKLNSLCVGKDAVEQSCLTAAQITGEQQDRCLVCHNNQKI